MRLPLPPRMVCRLAFFLAAAVWALHLPALASLAGIVPALSPLLNGLTALARRALPAHLGWCLPLLLLAFWRSRWFCRWLCPTGLAAEWAGRWNRRAAGRFARYPHLGRLFLGLMVGGALAGYPLLVWLDPLSLFQGFFTAWRRAHGWHHLLPAAGFVLVLLISAARPQVWCHRLCPLGATQDLLTLARRALERRHPARAALPAGRGRLGRRAFLAWLGGGAAAWGARRMQARPPLPVRPPGAAAEDRFAALCARCGNCLRACPAEVIRPDLGQSGIGGLLTPVLRYDRGYCEEYCRACTTVCPTSALRPLALAEKRNWAIGRAEIRRDRCIAWSSGAYCMVCQEYCPYLAIEPVERGGIPCPTVKADFCRGCGACEVNCPARPQRAIVVAGLPQQPARALPDFQ